MNFKILKTHNQRDDLWVCIHGRVYDVTEFQKTHPGGWRVFAAVGGTDSTQAFVNYHPKWVYKMLKKYDKGAIKDYKSSEDEFAADLIQLRKEFVKKRLFETNYWYYFGQAIWLSYLFSGAMYFTLATPWVKLGAFLMGCYWQQIAFIGHDIGHNAITHLRRVDYVFGIIVGNTTGGIGLGWWKHTHNVHHVIPNSMEFDPDNQHLPVFAVDNMMKAGFFSEFHQRDMKFTKLAAFLVSWQCYTYYFVMAFARINLYAQTIIFLASKEKTDYRKLEIVTITIFWIGIAMILNCLDSYFDCFVWMVISTAISGALEVQVTLSHYAEHTYSGKPETDWFRNQIRTTLDIDCDPELDWLHGGLQHQTAHHLFPRLPRHNLRYATERLKEICHKHDVKYNSLGFVDANIRLIKHLKRVTDA